MEIALARPPGPCNSGPVAHPGHLAQCSHCKQRERELPTDVKLKRCTGCSTVMYCSKSCQKAAWPQHRQSCRPAQLCLSGGAHELAGYNAPIALAQAVSDWADDVHAYAFQNIAIATVGANGGIAANLSSRILIFDLTPGAEKGGSGNPADAFRLVNVAVVDKEDVGTRFGGWDYITTECRRKKDWFRRHMPESIVLGAMPAVSRVVGTGLVTHHYYAIAALHCGAIGALPECIRAVFEDVATLCFIMINAGRVMIPSMCSHGHDSQGVPIVGKMVQQKKKWEWQASERFEWESVDEAGTILTSGLRPSKVWALYNAV